MFEIAVYKDLSPSLLEKRLQNLAGLQGYFSFPCIPRLCRESLILVMAVR